MKHKRTLHSGFLATLSCLLLWSLFPGRLAAQTFVIHNLMPDFWRFWAAAEGKPIEEQARLWQQLYVSPHQAIFNDLAGPCKDEFDPTWARTSYFPALPKIVPQMRAMTDNLPQKLTAAQNRFLKMFPDMSWAGDIYVMASGYCFNGRAQMIQGRSAVLFGLDATVALGQKDMVPGMTHELFHRYHHGFFDFEPSSGYPLWTTLWAEGLAQYVSEVLNPGASDADLAHVPAGMKQGVDTHRQELAADFLKRFDSTTKADADLYFNNIRSKDPLVPARGGYELGVLVVAELAKHYPIQTLAHWSRSEAMPHIREALMTMAAQPQPSPGPSQTN